MLYLLKKNLVLCLWNQLHINLGESSGWHEELTVCEYLVRGKSVKVLDRLDWNVVD
jgi:hypothetical protein